MELSEGKVAVVTGAAHGIGFAIAREACSRGMRVALADIDTAGLETAIERLLDTDADVSYLETDVSEIESVRKLADWCYEKFGRVDLLCNNAGIVTGDDCVLPAWGIPHSTWLRTVSVNLWGVVHGCLAFLPRMVKQTGMAYVLNTASSAGLTAGPICPAYSMTKSAIVSLSETLSAQMTQGGHHVVVSVLCPGMVSTSLLNKAFDTWAPKEEAQIQAARELRSSMADGSDPGEIAAIALRAVESAQLYIIPHESTRERIEARFKAMRDCNE
jgi:NAD(P)-dependent dehydrogenase (short-subunit alcohol dehydrogenase family)